jgi:hypothetical protein
VSGKLPLFGSSRPSFAPLPQPPSPLPDLQTPQAVAHEPARHAFASASAATTAAAAAADSASFDEHEAEFDDRTGLLSPLEVSSPPAPDAPSAAGASSGGADSSDMNRGTGLMRNYSPSPANAGGGLITTKSGAIDRHKLILLVVCATLALWVIYDTSVTPCAV